MDESYHEQVLSLVSTPFRNSGFDALSRER